MPNQNQSDELKSLNTERVSLQNKVADLETQQDRWHTAYMGLAVGAIALGLFSWFSQWKESGKSFELRPSIGRISKIDERISEIDKKVSDAALIATQGEVSATQLELAKQQTRAATAEKNLLELQGRIKPRRLTDKQTLAFVEALKVLPIGTIDFGYTSAGGDEGFNFAKQILPLFKQAGWIVRNEASIANHLDIQVIGVGVLISVPAGSNPDLPPSGYIELTPTLKTLQNAFHAIGIEVQFISWFPGKTAPEVVIGSKPEPTP